MTHDDRKPQETIDPETQTQIDGILDRYEVDLREDRRTSVADLLELVASKLRSRLFRELLLRELKIKGQSCDFSSHIGQFPDMADVARDVLAERDSNAADTTINYALDDSSGSEPRSTEQDYDANVTATFSSNDFGEASPTRPAMPTTRYNRQHLHATGGIGQVWVARDQNINRDIALKELRPDRVGSAGHRDRFLFEAQVTGQLEHPGVVPVYDLDANGDSPTYAMRFFRGRTLKEAIDVYHQRKADGLAQPVEFADLLNAFTSICNTIEYAHSRGVIHRDLKGHNVVLGDFGEVIVLDWGLAKQCDQADADEVNEPVSADSSSSTQVGAVVGTPAYMSPEQAAGQSEHVGPGSDVYALGVILFEILAGRPPFKAESTLKLLQKVIHESIPTEPLSSAPKPLAAVCLKALAKQPEDRFESPREMADDIRRFMADEPVHAWREPFLARCARWARRHRTLVTTAAGVLVVAVFALSVGTALLADANERVSAQREIAVANGDRAERNFRRALGAVDEFLTKVSENKLLDVPGMHSLRRDLLESALNYYQEFAREHQDDPAVQVELADAHHRIGQIQMVLGETDSAAESFDTAMKLLQDTRGDVDHATREVEFLMDVASLHEATGKYDKALVTYRQVIELLKEQVGHNQDVAVKLNLAANYLQVARLLHRTQSLDESRKEADAAIEIYQLLAEANPRNLKVIIGLAHALTFRGILQRDAGDPNATQTFADALRFMEPIREEFSHDLDFRNILSATYHSQAMLLRNQGQFEDAQKSFAAAIEIRQSLTRDFPSVPRNWIELATSYNSLGILHWRVREFDDALRYYRLASEQQQRLVTDHPKIPLFRDDLASSFNNIGMIHRQRGNFTEAVAAYENTIRLRHEFADQGIDSAANQVSLGSAFRNLGRVYYEQNDFEKMLESCDKSIEVLDAVYQRIGEDPRVRFYLRKSHWDRAECLIELARPADAAAAWDAAWKFDDGRERDFIAMQRCYAHALAGNHAQAVQEAKQLAAIDNLDSDILYDGACVFALSIKALAGDSTISPEQKVSLTDDYGRQCVSLLTQAQARDHFDSPDNRQHFESDKDLATVRERADFKEFASKLPQAPKPTEPES